MRACLIPLLVLVALFGQNIEKSFAAKVTTKSHFLKSRAPLAKDQEVLLTRAFYNYLLARPEALHRCVKSLIAQTRFSDLKKTPELFDVFKLLRKRTETPTAEMSLPFINDPAVFNEICQISYGVCQGITNLDRRLAMLIYYDPKNVSGQPLPPAGNFPERFAYYESVIAQVMKGRPMVLAGFADLASFARDPLGRRVLMEASVKLWATENATLPSITQVLQGIRHTVSKVEVESLHSDLSARIALHYPPIIYLARSPQEAKQKWIHVLQVLSVTPKNSKDGSYRIQVKDPNFSAIRDRIRYIEMDGKGKAMYDGAPLTEINIAPGDDQEIARFLVNTIDFCRDNPLFCTVGGVVKPKKR